MTTLDSDRLLHPELLAIEQLREILKNSCIEFENIQKLSRADLLDMYRHVALPLPQRQQSIVHHAEVNSEIPSKHLPAASICKNFTATQNLAHNRKYTNSLSIGLSKETKDISQTDKNLKLKPSICDSKPCSKKICLSTIPRVVDCSKFAKRKPNETIEDSNLSSMSKRQRITWP